MRDNGLLGSWVRRFLLEHLIGERNLARNTQRSYRDTLRLLLPFAARRAHKAIDRLTVEDLTANRVLAFLEELEKKRGCGAATRNQRLAAVHSLRASSPRIVLSTWPGAGGYGPSPSRRRRRRW